jgi:hypothetical protein
MLLTRSWAVGDEREVNAATDSTATMTTKRATHGPQVRRGEEPTEEFEFVLMG